MKIKDYKLFCFTNSQLLNPCWLIVAFIFFATPSFSQVKLGGEEMPEFDHVNPKDYEIGGITVSGTRFLDQTVLINLSGLTVGEKVSVPGDDFATAIENLWKQGLFADVKITATKIQGDKIFINIHLEERPRLSKFSFRGVKKSDADDIREKIKLVKGKVVTDNLIVSTKNTVKDFYVDKGYLDAKINIRTVADSVLKNGVIIIIEVNKGGKIRVNDIVFRGNDRIPSSKLRKALKDTKQRRWYSVFTQSKFIAENYNKEKIKVINKYAEYGFRDAQIIHDTTYRYNKKSINIEITIDEGKQYYFRNISFLGNTKHSTKELSGILNIKKGDVFDQSVLDQRLNMSQDSRDISSLYMDDGYLFFQVTPAEVLVENDSIDIEVRIYEGKQAIVNKVTVSGNTKTNDRVIMREIRTKPGQLFSRADIIRTQRELSQLRYFNAEKMGVNPIPNPADGTVDIEYTVEEQPSDQIELSGGWGANRLVGTLGVSFNNFSTKNLFKSSAWRPLPAGDGQSLERAQTNGLYYQSYNATFIEPWLGGKKPNSFSVSAYYNVQSNGISKKQEKEGLYIRSAMNIMGVTVGFGKRLKKPDDFFTPQQSISYQHYILHKYTSFVFSDGVSNSLSYKVTLSRNSIDQPIYPRSGSNFLVSLQMTPPYSLFRKDDEGNTVKDYSNYSLQERYKWVEYHKWKFTSQWYLTLFDKLVLNTKAGFGFLGMYNQTLGASPFERFFLGGSGLTGYNLLGGEYIALRGYADNSLSGSYGSTFIGKYTMELRYPISLNPSATIFMLAFAEGGNTWTWFDDYNPFAVKRSTGAGIRIFLPMFGLLGLDYGFNLDQGSQDAKLFKGHFHFTIGANIGDL